jgi:MoaA/NifB/PqqE/SkfB family radical SAM enzyme
MIAYSNIRNVHLEAATLCNAACPWCPRNFWGYPHNSGYPETYLTLDQAKKIFSRDFLEQLTSIDINGNFGDIVMNPQGADIVEYFLSVNPALDINISTNGSGRDSQFWSRLGSQKINVMFCLDGLEDTHHLYRQNTSWQRILKNANTFITAGGVAVWKMIQFDHNQHQIDQCQQLSQELGFSRFVLTTSDRTVAPVFDHVGQLTHMLGDYQGEKSFPVLFYSKQHDEVLLEDIVTNRQPRKKLSCDTVNRQSIYIAANGDVSPCCFLGYYPRTYGQGQYHQAANAQVAPLMTNNNALEHSLETCVQWFQNVQQQWSKTTYQDGRLVICDDCCGCD